MEDGGSDGVGLHFLTDASRPFAGGLSQPGPSALGLFNIHFTGRSAHHAKRGGYPKCGLPCW